MIRLWIQLHDLRDDRRGQDLIEYALMGGFVAVAAGALMPGVANAILVIFVKVNIALGLAGGGNGLDSGSAVPATF